MKKVSINGKKVVHAELQEELSEIFGFSIQYVSKALKLGAPAAAIQSVKEQG